MNARLDVHDAGQPARGIRARRRVIRHLAALALGGIAALAGWSAGRAAALPLGDGKVSQAPQRGYVYACRTRFRGGGARGAGPWIGDGTWDPARKVTVQGKVYWPAARFSVTVEGAARVITGNGLPLGSPTGVFPIRPSDPAFAIDRNPNSIRAQDLSYRLPAAPVPAPQPSCVPMGPIGVALNGVLIFNALDDGGRDAVAHEVQDLCDGHPQQFGQYHYHGPSPCMPHAREPDALVGYALDGFGITSAYGPQGRVYTDADLDACHGTTSPIVWDGRTVTMYHYVLTFEYPYTVGCFRGTPAIRPRPRGGPPSGLRASDTMMPGAGPPGFSPPDRGAGPPGRFGPPPPALDACRGQSAESPCRFDTPRGRLDGTCRMTPGGAFACVP